MEKTTLTEKVMISPDIKQVLYSLKAPGERLGDVVARLVKSYKRDEFIEYLDRIARTGEFVPLDDDPEFADMKRKRMDHEGTDRTQNAPVH